MTQRDDSEGNTEAVVELREGPTVFQQYSIVQYKCVLKTQLKLFNKIKKGRF